MSGSCDLCSTLPSLLHIDAKAGRQLTWKASTEPKVFSISVFSSPRKEKRKKKKEKRKKKNQNQSTNRQTDTDTHTEETIKSS